MSRDDIPDKEVEGVSGAPANKQYDYSVGQAADWGEVWLLRRGETEHAVLEGDEGDEGGFAVWPHRQFAEAAQKDGLFEDYEPVRMELAEFLDGLIPHLLDDGLDVAVMPLPDGRTLRVPPRKVRGDLETALQAYE